MPEEDYEEPNAIVEDRFGIDYIGLEMLVFDDLKKGKIVRNAKSFKEEDTESIHYQVYHLREMMKELNKLYESNATREEFRKVVEKRRRKMDDDIHDFMARMEDAPLESFMKVVNTKKDGDKITVVFEKVNEEEKNKAVHSIARKLVECMSQEQLTVMFEQMVKKLNDVEKLQKIDKELDKKDVKLEGKRGCYKLVIGDTNLDLMLVA